jgi:hypothetical protein
VVIIWRLFILFVIGISFIIEYFSCLILRCNALLVRLSWSNIIIVMIFSSFSIFFVPMLKGAFYLINWDLVFISIFLGWPWYHVFLDRREIYLLISIQFLQIYLLVIIDLVRFVGMSGGVIFLCLGFICLFGLLIHSIDNYLWCFLGYRYHKYLFFYGIFIASIAGYIFSFILIFI